MTAGHDGFRGRLFLLRGKWRPAEQGSSAAIKRAVDKLNP